MMYQCVVVLALDGKSSNPKIRKESLTNPNLGVGRYFTEVPTPTLDKFFNTGASSFTAKAVVPTDSAQNWGSILTGVLPTKHELTNGKVESGQPYNKNEFPTVYQILATHYSDIKLASFVAWNPINTGIIEQDVKVEFYAPLTHENIIFQTWLRFRHWCKRSDYDSSVVSRVIDYIANSDDQSMRLLLIHLTDVDEYGHHYGYGSELYLNQIKILDTQIAAILKAVKDTTWGERALTIITTDHGGTGRGHGGNSIEELNVFVAINGSDIKPNSTIGEVKNMDCAAVILEAFGVPIPDNFDAVPLLNW